MIHHGGVAVKKRVTQSPSHSITTSRYGNIFRDYFLIRFGICITWFVAAATAAVAFKFRLRLCVLHFSHRGFLLERTLPLNEKIMVKIVAKHAIIAHARTLIRAGIIALPVVGPLLNLMIPEILCMIIIYIIMGSLLALHDYNINIIQSKLLFRATILRSDNGQ
jgi:hypothetical protein